MTAETETGAAPLRRARWLAEQANWLAAHSRATELGRRARRAYLDRTQVRNLQRVAETALAVSTILDYIKVQVGKQPVWRRESFGTMLLDDLERLQVRAGSDADLAGKRHLELCRLFVGQLAAAYVYSIAVDATAPRTPTATPRATPPVRDAVRPPRQRGQRAGDPRGARTADAAAPAPVERPVDSAETEAPSMGAVPESAGAGIDVRPAGDRPALADNAAEMASEVAPTPLDAIEQETATPEQAPPVRDVADTREPAEETSATQEEAE